MKDYCIISTWIFNSRMFIIQKIWKTKKTVNWDFSQTPKQVYRKLQHGGKIFAKFQGQPPFSRKVVLYSLTKLGIIKTWSNIPWLRRFDLHLSRLQNKFIGNYNIQRKFSESFNVSLAFPENWFCIRLTIWHYKDLKQYSMAQKIWFALFPDFKTSL